MCECSVRYLFIIPFKTTIAHICLYYDTSTCLSPDNLQVFFVCVTVWVSHNCANNILFTWNVFVYFSLYFFKNYLSDLCRICMFYTGMKECVGVPYYIFLFGCVGSLLATTLASLLVCTLEKRHQLCNVLCKHKVAWERKRKVLTV